MRAVDFVGLPDIRLVPVLITGLISAKDEVGSSTRVECEQDSIRPASMLGPKFFHIGMTGIADRIDMRAAKKRTDIFEQIHGEINAFVFIVGQLAIPRGKLVADFNCSRHD
jgi:hypothetical protein